jgi:Flp pilus assembly protein TadG
MVVELAVCIPVMMAVVAIAINLMVFLGDCARFDRAAAEVVRIRATSPAYDSYGLGACSNLVKQDLQQLFDSESGYLRTTVTASVASASSAESSGGAAFTLLPHRETYTCQLEYRPWGFGTTFFGVEFSGITHTRSFTVDPFRPGVLL